MHFHSEFPGGLGSPFFFFFLNEWLKGCVHVGVCVCVCNAVSEGIRANMNFLVCAFHTRRAG